MDEAFDVVFFDCDSTLSGIEGIDELAREAGLGDEMAALTRSAMEGGVPLERVYGRRLEAIRPNRRAIERLGRSYVDHVVAGAREVVGILQRLGKEVHVVSGGLRDALLPLTRYLGLPDERVHAVALRFEKGAHAGYDEGSPLARSGGKSEVCTELLAGSGARAAFVGDGTTDCEASPPCALFVGFGGVVTRPEVRRAAGAWVPGPSLRGVLEHLLTEDERRELRHE